MKMSETLNEKRILFLELERENYKRFYVCQRYADDNVEYIENFQVGKASSVVLWISNFFCIKITNTEQKNYSNWVRSRKDTKSHDIE